MWGAKRNSGDLLDLEEVRIVADLRIMHANVDELAQIVANLKRRRSEKDMLEYAPTRSRRKHRAL